jgi:hypothetical protein
MLTIHSDASCLGRVLDNGEFSMQSGDVDRRSTRDLHVHKLLGGTCGYMSLP